MNIYFALMLVLLATRIVYYVYVKIVQPLLNIKKEVFNLWLILPYLTEIILNMVIFYYNFVKEVSSTSDEEEEEEEEFEQTPMLPTVMVDCNQYNQQTNGTGTLGNAMRQDLRSYNRITQGGATDSSFDCGGGQVSKASPRKVSVDLKNLHAPSPKTQVIGFDTDTEEEREIDEEEDTASIKVRPHHQFIAST